MLSDRELLERIGEVCRDIFEETDMYITLGDYRGTRPVSRVNLNRLWNLTSDIRPPEREQTDAAPE